MRFSIFEAVETSMHNFIYMYYSMEHEEISSEPKALKIIILIMKSFFVGRNFLLKMFVLSQKCDYRLQT